MKPSIKLLTKLYNVKKVKPSNERSQTAEDIVAGVTSNQMRASIIMNWLSKKQNSISWNKHRNLVLFGQPIPETDFVDILQGSLRQQTNLNSIPGLRLFFETLRTQKAPSNLFENKQGKRILTQS